jgi:hypothetical protein
MSKDSAAPVNTSSRALFFNKEGSSSDLKRAKDRGAISVNSSVDNQIRHTFDEVEIEAFAEHITTLVKGDPDLADVLPITAKNLFDVVSKGVLLRQ